MSAFVECDVCKIRPSMPTLCGGCIRNRETITNLETEVIELKMLVETGDREIRGLEAIIRALQSVILRAMNLRG